METEHGLLQWSALFKISDGKVVGCSGLAGQELMDAEQKFLRTEHCLHHRSQTEFPWITLHGILDSFKG